MLYFCSSLPACLFEMKVNGVDFNTIRDQYHYTQVEVDLSRAEKVPESFYPKDWTEKKLITQKFGQDWAQSGRTLLLGIRCAPLPTETNYLINPKHSDFKMLKFSKPKSIPIDPRII